MQATREPTRVAEAQRCCEPGCDRPPLADDQRCALHSSRLGALSRSRAVEVIAPEAARHDGPVVVPLPLPQRHPYRWSFGALGSIGALVLAVALKDSTDFDTGLFHASPLPFWLRATLGSAGVVFGPYAGFRAVRDARDPSEAVVAWPSAILASGPAALAAVALVLLAIQLVAWVLS